MRRRSILSLEYLETRETPSSIPPIDPYGNPLPPSSDPPGQTPPPPPSGGGGSTGPIDPYSPPPGG